MSQSSNVSVEHSAVSGHVESLRVNHEQLKSQASSFLSAIEPLRGVWKGASVEAWNSMTEAWSENMDLVNQALEELTSRVEQAGKDYQVGEDDQAATLQQRFSGMNFQSGPIL